MEQTQIRFRPINFDFGQDPWDRSGRMPEGSDELQRRAVLHDPTTHVWRGSDLPTQEQGIIVLGCPLGHADFVTAQLKTIAMKHQVLSTNFHLRVVRPDLVVQFARTHDASLWQCMCTILGFR